MSTTVDNKVVSMKFDNKDFERNVSQSMSTLDKLKRSLNMDKSVESFNQLDKASKKVSFDDLSSSAEKVKVQFSALEVVAVTALANITTAAMHAGANIVKSLTIDQVTAGFSEYELKMNSVQTIMSGTGESLDVVMNKLNELNEYADRTIYVFSDMTSNIGKFTNAGIDLDTAVAAMKGLSNEAALAGANATEASRAMYNVAQAFSMGYMQYIDWKSIENANMATMDFKQNLVETALALGTLSQSTVDSYDNISALFKDEMQNGWLTNDVMLQTLTKYSDETTDLGKRAYAAAQDVKTFSQLMDTMREAIGSGWAQTFEIVIGNFDEAKSIFTDLSNYFGGIVSNIADARNTLLSEALGGSFDTLTTKITDAGVSLEDFEKAAFEVGKRNGLFDKDIQTIDDLNEKFGSFQASLSSGWLNKNVFLDTLKELEGSATAVSGSLEDLEAVAARVINGEFGYGADRMKKLADEGYNFAAVQNLVNEQLGNAKHYEVDLSDAQLKASGYTNEQIIALRELESQARRTGTPLSELIESMNKPTGRELLIETLTNSWSAFTTVLKAVGEAWNNTFDKMDSADIYGMIEAAHSFSEKLMSVEGQAEKIQRTFQGVFGVLHVIQTIVKTGLTVGLKILGAAFGIVGDDVLDVTAVLGDMLSEFDKWFHGNDELVSSIQDVTSSIVDAILAVHDWADANIPLMDILGGIGKVLGGVIIGIADFISGAISAIDLQNGLAVASEYLNSILEKLGPEFSDVSGGFSDFIDDVKELVGEQSGMELINSIFDSFVTNVASKFPDLSNGFSSIKDLLVDFKDKCSDALDTTGDKVSGFTDSIQDLVDKIKALIPPNFLSEVLAAGLGISIIVFTKKTAEILGTALGSVSEVLDSIEGVFNSLSGTLKTFSKKIKAEALLKIAQALLILVAALGVLTLLIHFDGTSLLKACGVLVALGVGLVALSKAVSGFSVSGSASILSVAATVIAISVAISILVKSLKSLNGMELENMYDELALLGIVIAALMGVTVVIGKFSNLGDVAGGASCILAVAVAIKILISAINDLSGIDMSGTSPGTWAALVLCMGSMVGLFALAASAEEKVLQGSAAILIIAVAMNMLVHAIQKVADLDLSNMTFGKVVLLGAIMAYMVVLFKASKHAGKEAMQAGIGIAAMVIAMDLMVGLVKKLQKLDGNGIGIAIGMMIVLNKFIKSMIKTTERGGPEAAKAGVFLLGVSVAILAFATAVVMLGKLPLGNLAKGVAALGLVTLMMNTMLNSSKNATGDFRNIITLATTVGALAVALVALSLIEPTKLAAATLSLSAVMGMFALMEKVASGSKIDAKTILTMTAFVGIIGILATIVGLLANFTNATQAIATAGALSMLLLSLSASCAILNIVGPKAIGAIPAAGLLALIVGGLAVVVGLLANCADASSVLTVSEALSKLLLSMSASLGVLTLIGLAGPAAFVGLGALSTLIVGLTAIIVGLGALNANCEAFRKFMDEGMPLLEELGYSLGGFFGNIVNGFLSEAAKCLPDIATTLSEFSENLSPFLDDMSKVKDSSIDNAGKVADMIMTLTKAELVNGLASLFSGDLADFATELKTFGEGILAFSDTMSDNKIDVDAITDAAEAGTAIAEMASKIPNEGGVLAELVGDNTLGAFGSSLETFGTGIVNFSNAVSKAEINIDAIKTAAEATQYMVDVANEVPNSGGEIEWWSGNNDIDAFAEKLPGFGKSMADFSANVKDKIDKDAIKTAAEAASSVVDFANAIPNTDGVVGWWTGDNDIDDFGVKLVSFGGSLADFSEEVQDVATYKLENISGFLADMAAIDLESLAYSNIGYIGDNLLYFGEKVNGMADYFDEINEDDLKLVLYTIDEILESFTDANSAAKDAMSSTLQTVLDIIDDNTGDYEDAGESLMEALVTGLNTKDYVPAETMQTIVDTALVAINASYTDFYNAGANLTKGFNNGISSGQSQTKTASAGVAAAALGSLKKGLDEHSPSKKAHKAGAYFTEGFVNGVKSGTRETVLTVSSLASSAIDTIKSSIGIVSSLIQNGIDDDVKIRPVLDLSDIKAGVSTMNGMLNNQYTIGAAGMISASMNRNKVKSTNDDVVSAIGKLQKTMSNMDRPSYNINGVTYNEGSDVSEAIKTLVNAVVIEGRV